MPEDNQPPTINMNENSSADKIPVPNGRRYFWEPIFDGKVIASVGEMFNQDVKKEADKEREERENLLREALFIKYTSMLNAPKELAKLKEMSDNSPKEINQTFTRRSLSSNFEDKAVKIYSSPDKSTPSKRSMKSAKRRRSRKKNHHRGGYNVKRNSNV